MTATLRHRGPDSEGFFVAPGIAFGFRRLAIIDLAGGDQPIANEDGSIIAVCNGEIYNFVELRGELEARGHRFRTGSDTETILHLYEERGPDCVHSLRGMFAFAIWDSRLRRLMLARDRLGIKPLHYALRPGRIEFGSEYKAIVAASETASRPDLRALRDLLDLGFVAGTRTLADGIRRLAPGEYLLYSGGSVSVQQYWDVRFPTGEQRRSEAEWVEAFREKLTESVRIHMRSDVPVGVWLSPGIDSSAVAALASRFASDPLESFTLAFDDPRVDEVRRAPTLNRYPGFAIANRIARCGDDDFRLFAEALWTSEEPTSAMIPRLLLARATRPLVKVVLTGEGADEVLGGYPWYRVDRFLRPAVNLPLWLRRVLLRGARMLPGWNHRLSSAFLAPASMGMSRYRALALSSAKCAEAELLAPEIQAALGSRDEEELPVRLPDEFGSWNSFQQLQYLDLRIRLPEFVVHSLDRGSMSEGVEARVPFLDHELVELASRIPVALRMRALQEKYILRQAMRGILPSQILSRRKYGMTAPMNRWWRLPLPAFAEEALSRKALVRTGWFNPAAVKALLDMHREGRARRAKELTTVLAVQLKFGSA